MSSWLEREYAGNDGKSEKDTDRSEGQSLRMMCRGDGKGSESPVKETMSPCPLRALTCF